MRREVKFVIFVTTILLAMPFLLQTEANTSDKVVVKVATINPVASKMEEKSISLSDAKLITDHIQSAEDAFKIAMDPNSNESQKSWAIKIIEKLINELKEIGLLPASFIFSLPQFLSPKFAFLVPVISIGSGFSYIPLYPGEAFIGFMLRPIFLQYFLFGYTASINLHFLPPRLEYWDMVGTQTAMILGFAGVYIDFGKIGYGIPNMQFLLGESFFVTGVDWL